MTETQNMTKLYASNLEKHDSKTIHYDIWTPTNSPFVSEVSTCPRNLPRKEKSPNASRLKTLNLHRGCKFSGGDRLLFF